MEIDDLQTSRSEKIFVNCTRLQRPLRTPNYPDGKQLQSADTRSK
jgi:hypothetical protein